MKVFLDTNVLISGFAAHGLCHDLVARMLATEAHRAVVSEQVVDEVTRILQKELGRPLEAFPFAAELIRGLNRVTEDTSFEGIDIPDADDVPILGSALACQTDVCITGDKARLAVRAIGDMRIAAPRDAWDLLVSRN